MSEALLISNKPEILSPSSPTGVGPVRRRTFSGLHNGFSHLSQVNNKLKGKAALELRELKDLSLQRFKELREQVKVEVKQIELERKENIDREKNEKSKHIHGGWVLNREQIEFLSSYPYIYCAKAGSYLELLFLQKFWTWLSRFVPTCIAPSVITFTGLAINVLCCLNVLYFSPDLKSEIPPWSLYLCALGLFLYQTFDALDGKQCGKTQSTQVEELTDHGCDAVSTVFLTLSTSAAIQLGHNPFYLFLLFLTAEIAFFSTHWLAHISHCMIFGKIDVSEAQIVMITVYCLTGWFGHGFWRHEIINLFGFSLRPLELLVFCSLLGGLKGILENISMSALGAKTPLESLGVNIPRRQSVSRYNPLITIGLLATMAVKNYVSNLFSISPTVFVLTYGFAFAKIILRLVMMNVTRGYFQVLDSSLACPSLLCFNNILYLLHPYTALLCAFVYTLMDFLRYFTYALWDLRVALDVFVFSVKYPKGHPKNKSNQRDIYMNGLNDEEVLVKWQRFEKEEKDGLLKHYFRTD